MYAHKIIEDLKNPNQLVWSSHRIEAASLLRDSNKFSIGSFKSSTDSFKYSDFKDSVLTGWDYQFPYKNMYIDGSFYGTQGNHEGILFKQAFLILSNDDSFVYYSFANVGKNGWVMLPYTLGITKDGDLIEEQLASDLMANLMPVSRHTHLDGAHKILSVLQLLNCKNIATIDNHPPEKLNKKRAKSGKCPLFTYKTLVIKPTEKKQAQNEAQNEAQGLWENRVHLCRGHFKTYTEKNPLFGRLTGRYWWQPSVRGNKKKGIVMKDYKVEA